MSGNYCPLCGEENKCTVKQGYCWCEKESAFPEGIIKLIPVQCIGKQCICHKCLVNYKGE
ncbi:cysteine-rich CWC family protein [Oceanobacillus damuensis]|uniref:cysteine-rich CWC family protein n=1 Tax=Oceanobacillus damuensis TaxID=937928 RepID=UPI000A073B00|nr:cysteine-rich CWC family protein [Oceanobacillus damuensis]